MLTDRFGGRHSSNDGTAVAAFEGAVLGIAAHRPTAGPALELALAADPNLTAAHALKGAVNLMAESAERCAGLWRAGATRQPWHP
jgi:hypothetical protein